MSGLRIVCPICTDEFRGADDIYSTSCGHLYHYRCMMEWQSRSTSCPQCREFNPTKHKIFLNLEDAIEVPTAPPVQEDLKIKLESSVDKIHELKAQLEESELNFFHLQEQYTVEQDARKQLENRVAQSNDSDTNFLRLHAQYSETEDRYKVLQEENERLAIENEYKLKELSLKSTEIDILKESLVEYKRSTSSDTVANAKIEILEQRLKHVTDELQKEISNSTQLAIEKIKLQSYIQRMEVQENVSQPLPEINKPSIENNRNILNVKTKSIPTPGRDTSNHQLDRSSSILLTYFPYKEINGSLKQAAISIASKINVVVSEEDITTIRLLNGVPRNPDSSVTIYVQLKTEELKKKFLANRGNIKKDDKFKKVGIKEFMDERIHGLFMYANKKLRGIVFGYIACEDNQIIAKKWRADKVQIIVQSREQVDELYRDYLAKKNVEPYPYLLEDKIDASFYKI